MATATRNDSSSGGAWYYGSRSDFLGASQESISGRLLERAALENLEILAEQAVEWQQSVNLLQQHLANRLPILREALNSPGGELIEHVVLEYDFRRRGLRIDCVLLAPGVLFVVEFKRSSVQAADRDQVMRYAINLVEFHKCTREWTENAKGRIVPVVALTQGAADPARGQLDFGSHSWPAVANAPFECDRRTFSSALASGIANRIGDESLNGRQWLSSDFSPSSTVIDAAISLYGNHDVSAIREHATSVEAIQKCVSEIENKIDEVLNSGGRSILFVTGAPGAGKTLVGLDIALRGRHSARSVFVTGNTPLVDVLSAALGQAYRRRAGGTGTWTVTGYRRADARTLAGLATFKIVKAHHFLRRDGSAHSNPDERVLVFDEAQRTYRKGKRVLGVSLRENEAELILEAQEETFKEGGTVIVALVGHNQAINAGELGMEAWFAAAEKRNWKIAIGDVSLDLTDSETRETWAAHQNRSKLKACHLSHSMRFYRNASLERWAGEVLEDSPDHAAATASELADQDHTVWLTRDFEEARSWARRRAVGDERAGIIASSQARRLSAHGLFVQLKPAIEDWMLAANGDIRASSMLETVQNQYQVQGLEIDHSIVCWDLDLRRDSSGWRAFKIIGDDWRGDPELSVSKNSYRVLLTRARKSMIIFVPKGDPSGSDPTRPPHAYDEIAAHLRACGARDLQSVSP